MKGERTPHGHWRGYREKGEDIAWTLEKVSGKGSGQHKVDTEQGTMKGERTPHSGHWKLERVPRKERHDGH